MTVLSTLRRQDEPPPRPDEYADTPGQVTVSSHRRTPLHDALAASCPGVSRRIAAAAPALQAPVLSFTAAGTQLVQLDPRLGGRGAIDGLGPGPPPCIDQRGGRHHDPAQAPAGLREPDLSRATLRLPFIDHGLHTCDLLLDGVRGLHILTAQTYAELISRLTGELRQMPQARPPPSRRSGAKFLAAGAAYLRTVDFAALPPLDLGASTVALGETSEAYRRVFVEFHRLCGQRALNARMAGALTYSYLADAFRSSHQLADNVLRRQGLGPYSHEQWLVFKALVLRQVAACRPACEHLLASNASLYTNLTRRPVHQDWRLGTLARGAPTSSQPHAGAADDPAPRAPGAGPGRMEARGDTRRTAYAGSVVTFSTMPDSIDLELCLQVASIPEFEPAGDASEVARVDGMGTIDPTGKVLPGQIATAVDALMAQMERQPDHGDSACRRRADALGRRMVDLRSQAAALHEHSTRDGDLWTQVAVLLQRQSSLATMARMYRGLEEDVAHLWGDTFIASLPRPPAPVAPTEPAQRPSPSDLSSAPTAPSPGAASGSGEREMTLSWPEYLDRWCDPGNFIYPSETASAARDRLLTYHVLKHGAPGASKRAYVEEAMEVFRHHWTGEVRRRAGHPDGYIKVVRNDTYYGVYNWQDQLITFCHRGRCGAHHYPALAAERRARLAAARPSQPPSAAGAPTA